ncbi:MAG: MaoC family dehydratase [Pseudomonadota bacterium]
MSGFENLMIGERLEIGRHSFTEEAIIAFATKYDPQPFHVDTEAARRSIYGALCASGWHTAAVWMRLNVDYQAAQAARLREEGKSPPVFGPSPGISNVKWFKPVYGGDTITYFNTVTAARMRPSKPDWGIVELHSEGVNQKGDPVIAFDNAVLIKT